MMSGVTAPLFTADARDLRRLARPRWQRRLLAWTVPTGAVLLTSVHVAQTAGLTGCTVQSPCGPDPVGSVAVGLLAAAAVAGFVALPLAAWFAGGFLVTLVLDERVLSPGLASPVWLYLVDACFVGLCVAVARVGRDRPPTDRALQWLVGVRRERPPAPAYRSHPGGAWRLAARVLIVVAVAVAVWGWFAQRQVDAQQRAATRVTVQVTGHPDEFTVAVQLPGGPAEVNVLDAAAYPVGGRMDLLVDGQGLRQPVSEPYDATGWLLLAVFLAGLGVAAGIRAAQTGHGLRRLFDSDQPVTEVSVLAGLTMLAVYAGDARPGEPAVAEIRIGRTGGPERGVYLPATLYGTPAPGHWCAVVVDGEPVLPLRPLPARTPVTFPYRVDQFDAAAPDHRSLRAEELAALRPSDREAPPDQVHVHVRSPGVGYAIAAALPLALVLPIWFLDGLPYPTAVLIAAGTLAVACAVSWRFVLRGRIAWNAHGIAVIGAFGQTRVGWGQVRSIEADRSAVTVHTGDRILVVGAGPVFGIIGRADRDAEELANALRHMRNRHPDGGTGAGGDGPPRLPAPHPPLGLYAVWLLGSPVYAWLLQVYSGL
jgi:hypothetical protein